MLSCTCRDDYDLDGDTWAFFPPDDFSKLQTARRRRCCSCKILIDIGADCLKFPRIRGPKTDIEERIMGEEIPMTDLYMCEPCGEIYLNLSAVGYCLDITEYMQHCLEEYHELTGFVQTKTPPSQLHHRPRGVNV